VRRRTDANILYSRLMLGGSGSRRSRLSLKLSFPAPLDRPWFFFRGRDEILHRYLTGFVGARPRSFVPNTKDTRPSTPPTFIDAAVTKFFQPGPERIRAGFQLGSNRKFIGGRFTSPYRTYKNIAISASEVPFRAQERDFQYVSFWFFVECLSPAPTRDLEKCRAPFLFVEKPDRLPNHLGRSLGKNSVQW